jgi:hypothetical protein
MAAVQQAKAVTAADVRQAGAALRAQVASIAEQMDALTKREQQAATKITQAERALRIETDAGKRMAHRRAIAEGQEEQAAVDILRSQIVADLPGLSHAVAEAVIGYCDGGALATLQTALTDRTAEAVRAEAARADAERNLYRAQGIRQMGVELSRLIDTGYEELGQAASSGPEMARDRALTLIEAIDGVIATVAAANGSKG